MNSFDFARKLGQSAIRALRGLGFYRFLFILGRLLAIFVKENESCNGGKKEA
jgi:hypothetical protein